jgi:NAD(P)-dependent dehydrogenase (short-subunit alcohol dehydrogenase family)
MVTGASRGIGRASALRLAADGWDLVLTARKVGGGATFEGTTMGDAEAGAALPGSVEEVAAECHALGVEAVPVALDLTDPDGVAEAADEALGALGRVDALVSNAIYQGPGVNDRFLDVPLDLLRRVIDADAVAPLILLKRLLPPMLERGDGVFVHLTSGAATLAPRAPAGEGGWGLAYAMAKGAAHRIAGVLHAEHGRDGLRAYSLNPGHVVTDVMRLRAQRLGVEARGDSPDGPAAAVAWLLAGGPDAVALAGQEVVAREVVAQHHLR